MKNNSIYILGIDDTGLNPKKTQIIHSCPFIFAAKRFFPLLRSITNQEIIPIAPLSKALSKMDKALAIDDVAVLASGDPLFFGIGKTLCNRFGGDVVQIHPAVSSMQMVFSRFKISWDDAHFFSVHGREVDGLITRILTLNKVFLFTDSKNSPAVIATSLLKEIGEMDTCLHTVHVAENLGEENERLTTGTLQAISNTNFGSLNAMIITRKDDCIKRFSPRFGLREDEINHSRGLITKNEVRAATLHSLRLPDEGVFWDIGAGSGSISLEAAMMFPLLRIFAVESKAEQIRNIYINKKRFNAYNISVIHGNAPGEFINLPDPDRIFIGGSGGKLSTILEYAGRRLRPGGIIVVNGVIEKTRDAAPKILHGIGFSVSIATVSVSRCRYPENICTELNPITIITGLKSLAIIKEGLS